METVNRGELALLHGLHVLLVEDDDECRDMFAAILECVGVEVLAAATAREGLRALDVTRADAVISDITLPGEDGCWLIRQLRATRASRHVPAIAVTAHGPRHRDRALASGFDHYLEKPVDPSVLYRVLAQLVGASVD